jgi:biotin carboxylase
MKNSFIKSLLVICFLSSSILCTAQENKRRNNYTLSVNSKIGETTMTRDDLKNATIGVEIFNSEFKEKVRLQGFTFKCPGQKALVIKGDKLTADAIQCIMGTKIGNYITIYDARIPG